MKRLHRQLNLTLLLLTTIFFVSCEKKDDAPTKEASEAGISKEFTRGPATMIVALDKKELTLAERTELTIDVIIEEGYEVELPIFGKKLQEFQIVDFYSSQPELTTDNKVRHRKTFELEPFLSGTYKIPVFTVKFKKTGEDKEYKIENEELELTVTSLMEEGKEIVLNDIVGPIEPPTKPIEPWKIAAAAGGAVTLIALIFIIRRLMRKEGGLAAIIKRDPAEVAYEQLSELVAEDLIEKGEIKLFYLRLSGVLRHYIENRFALHAPEQTTEEFMDELRKATIFEDAHKQLLKAFLQHCDMVKFAELRPE
ncbi:hypothetical protein BVY04_00035, partial [bacterium M21]